MNRRSAALGASILGLALIGLAALFPAVAQQTPAAPAASAGPIVKAGATQKLSDHVYVISDGGVGGVPNVGFIVGSKATLVIDTGMGAPNGKTVLAEAQKLSATNKLYLVTTHVHPEHDLGAQAFPATTTMIRANAQVKEIAEEGFRTADMFRGRSEINKQLLEGAEFRKADVTFDSSYDLDLGGVKVKLFALGPGHTQGDTVTFVEGDNVLFSGDLAMRALPAFASSKSSARQWLVALDRMDALKPKIVAPSHGPIGDAAYIAGYRTYITRIQTRAAALKREGKSVDDAVAAITAELKADYPDTARAAGAIRVAYNEAQ
jgi:glyoxylase-like metal-dependent hydrolase (beta-lactamase superfamily II)